MHRADGRVVQVDPIKTKVKPPGSKRLILKRDVLLSNFAFKFNLRRYMTELCLNKNELTSVPAALGALTVLETLKLEKNQLESVPAEWEEGGVLQTSGCAITW